MQIANISAANKILNFFIQSNRILNFISSFTGMPIGTILPFQAAKVFILFYFLLAIVHSFDLHLFLIPLEFNVMTLEEVSLTKQSANSVRICKTNC